MMRYFVLLCISVITLYAFNNNTVLKRANNLIKSDDKSKQFRAYNDYKNLYLRSIMNDNNSLKLKSLKGIIESGKKLHIDVKQYSLELSHMKPQSKKQEYKNSVKVQSSYILQSSYWKDNILTLSFDKKLDENKVNYFTIFDDKRERYKYVFDIQTAFINKSHSVGKADILRVRIAQYKNSVLRLVIENNRLLKVKYNIKSNKLQISINNREKKEKRVVSQNSYISKYIAPKRLDRNKIIVIDAGHGGKDPGAIGYKKYREKMVVLSIAQKLKKILIARGYTVDMTRDGDNFVKLSHRTKFANRNNADIFISIHANAVSKKSADKVHGIECYFLSKSRSNRAKKVAAKENSADISDMNFYGKESFLNTLGTHNMIASNKLAIDLQRSMLASLKKNYNDIYDGGVREGPFWVLVGAQMPSVLVEVGFITHPREARRLVNNRYQKKLAIGLANGIERYFLNN